MFFFLFFLVKLLKYKILNPLINLNLIINENLTNFQEIL